MFNTDDKLIQGCMFLAGLIFFVYGAVMMFNTDFMMERYPTFENNQTTVFFLNWFGAVSFVAYVGILYMGFKGLDRGFFAYAIPVVLLQVIWIIMSNAQTGEENITGLVVWIILLALLVVSRVKAGMPFTYDKASSAFGVTDKTSQIMGYIAILISVINIVSYVIDPGGFIRQTPYLESSPQAEHAVLGITMINIAILISLVYQYRVGFSGVLISMGAVAATMFLAALMVGSVTNPESGNPLLAIFIILNFIVLMTIYFRNQSNF